MSNEEILIIDDNATNLKLEKILLSMGGYSVRTAIDAEEALCILQSHHPKLILMDLQLPGMSGFDLTKKLKKDPVTKDIIILAVTAFAMKGDKEKALQAGCDGYITKPIDTRTFIEVISNYLD